MKNLRPWIDKIPVAAKAVSSQLTQSDSTELGTVTELVDAQNVAVAIDGVGGSQPDVVAPGSGRLWVGARVRCLRDSSGRVTRVEAVAVDVLPSDVVSVDMDATTQWMAAEQSATAEALDSAREDLAAAMAQLNDPNTGLEATQQKADDAATAAAQAYEDAAAAQATANSKAKTFTSTPTPPYSTGDLWRNGNSVYICTTARASGSYTASDWTLTADKTSENTSADTSKVGGTASSTVIQNIATALANGKPFIQQATPSATAAGQLWFPTDSSGRVIGMKVSTATGTGSWQTYLMMAGQILVPGSVGTVSIGDSAITAPKITASDELWAKLATFAKVTTDMLVAGGAVITGDLLANVITGIILRGGLFEAGGGSLPMIRVGPLSGTPGTGDSYGVYLTTPNSNANGSASLEVTPTGPVFSMLDGSGNAILSMDKANGLKIVNATDGGLINLSDFVTKRWQWDSTKQGNVQVLFNSTGGWSPWVFFDAANNNVKIPSIATVTSPTGRFRIDCGWELPGASAYDNTLMQLQFGFYTQNPNSFNRTDITNSLLGQLGRANAAGPGIVGVHSGQGSEVFTGAANTTYWVRPFYRQRVMGSSVTATFNRMWASIAPA